MVVEKIILFIIFYGIRRADACSTFAATPKGICIFSYLTEFTSRVFVNFFIFVYSYSGWFHTHSSF